MSGTVLGIANVSVEKNLHSHEDCIPGGNIVNINQNK